MGYEIEEVGLSALSSKGLLLQSRLWARFKAEYGWTPRVVTAVAGPWSGTPILVLLRSVGPGLTLAYVPHAPPELETPAPAADLRDLGVSVAAAVPEIPFCVRFDLLWPAGILSSSGSVTRLSKSPVDIQPPDTVRIDLSADSEDLLAAMHKKWRYNIRLAGKKGVIVTRHDSGDAIRRLEQWYAIYRETARRDRITIHPLAYYTRLFELAGEEADSGTLHLYLAWHGESLLAGVIVAESGKEAIYLYGASSGESRELMPNYALQWAAIEGAKTRGAHHYDFFGIPPADDPSHPMHGLYRFKTGFGGEIVHREGSWDVTVQPLVHAAFRGAERVRSFYFHRVRKAVAR